MKIKPLIPIILIIILGGLLRFFNLDKFPVSPNWDEVSHGYNAYSILRTGMDEWGKHFPLIFRAFGDYKLPIYIYLTVLPVWIFGLNVFAVRFISALAGTLAIPGIYLLSKELFPDNKKLPLLSAFFLAILPWHFFISRPALEANLSLTLIIFGAYYLLRFFHKKTSLLPAVIFLGLSLHTYNTARVFVPLLVLATLFIFRSSWLPSLKASRTKNILAILISLLFASVVLAQIYDGAGTARYEKLKILSPGTIFQIGEKRSLSTLPPFVARVIYNRPIYFLSVFTKNYFSYFSPQFIFQTKGAQSQFAIPGENLLTLPISLLTLVGLIFSVSLFRKNPKMQFLYLWLLLSPVAASLTIDPPQALRPNPMIPTLIIFASLGLIHFLSIYSQKIRNIVLVVVLFWISISFTLFLKDYFGPYRVNFSNSWQYGYPEIMTYVLNHKNEYHKVFITKRYGEPHIFYAFYNQLSPTELQPNSENIRFGKSDWFWTDKIGQVYFINDWQIPTTSIKNFTLESGEVVDAGQSLLITSPDHLPINAHVISRINFLDGSPAFIISSVP